MELKVAVTTIVVTVVCLLPLMALLQGLRETRGIVIYQVFSITFTTLGTISFGDYFPQFKNNADHLLVLRAFA